MGILGKIFTWWDGATIGTALWSARNGTRVGEDHQGNVYFQGGKDVHGNPRRWVMYAGANDASRVPPEWPCPHLGTRLYAQPDWHRERLSPQWRHRKRRRTPVGHR